MAKLNKTLIAASLFVSLFVITGKKLQASGAGNVAADDGTKMQGSTLPLDSMAGLEIQSIKEDGVDLAKTKTEVATYRGRRALRIVNEDAPTTTGTPAGGEALAIVKTSDFKDGTIEVDIAGNPREGAQPSTRGFIGIAFRVQDHGSRYECIYLRMTNGRADDQLQRNHATQYSSQPDFPWYRLRKENPGVYESYVDLEAGAWTRLKIVVAGSKARLYVNGADQPCLIVNDLKLGETRGQVALWTGSDSDAYFSNLRVK